MMNIPSFGTLSSGCCCPLPESSCRFEVAFGENGFPAILLNLENQQDLEEAAARRPLTNAENARLEELRWGLALQ